MEKALTIPEKIQQALFVNNLKQDSSFQPQYFIVINAQNKAPQFFSRTFNEANYDRHGYGSFMDAELEAGEEAPVEIYDRETALYLIGLDAIQRTLCEENEITDAPIFRLMPVYGSMITDCITQNSVQ